MPNNDIDHAERLAASMARCTSKNQWIFRYTDGTYKVVPVPPLDELGLLNIQLIFTKRLGFTFEAEYDTTGRRVS